MKAISRRLGQLEQASAHNLNIQIAFRLIASKSGKKLNLETSSVQRTLNPNGKTAEVVILDGSRSGITDEGLDQFIARSPLRLA